MTPRARSAGKVARQDRIVFRGPPDRLASLLPEAESGGAREAVQKPAASLRGAEVRGLTVRTFERSGLNARRATLRLPKSTPPGTYQGAAEIEGHKLSIVAEVEERPRLEADPRRLSIEVVPGGTASVELTILNTGNVSCDLSGASTFCIFDGQGTEHAFWAALANDPPPGKQRIDVLLDDLAESHGGVVTARVEPGIAIEPGESRDVRLTLRFSDRLRPGKQYAGSWRAEGLRIPVRVTTPAAKPKRATRRAK